MVLKAMNSMLKTNKTAAKTEIIPALDLYLFNMVIVLATQIVQSLFFSNQAAMLLLLLYRPGCVGPGQNLRGPDF